MKMIFVLLSFLSLPTFAQSFHTADRLNYLVSLSGDVHWETCAKEICAISKVHGNGQCKYLDHTGIMMANLSSRGVAIVSDLFCVVGLEREGQVGGQPRLGERD